MTNSIIQGYKNYRKKRTKKFPKLYLYLGSYEQTVTEKNITYTYSHYDCFLGDSMYLRNCKKLKRLSGEYEQNIFEINPECISQGPAYSSDKYTLKDTHNNTYTIYGEHRISDFHDILNPVYNTYVSHKFINKYINNKNIKAMQSKKKTKTAQIIENEQLENLFNQEFTKK